MISNARIANELRSIARELVAGRRRMAWSMTEQGGINDDYIFMALNGGLERGKLSEVVPQGNALLYQCGDILKGSLLDYVPEGWHEYVESKWDPAKLEFLPSYFAGKDCVGYPMKDFGKTKDDIEFARSDDSSSVEYYNEDEKMSEREKSDRALNSKIESLTREIEQKSQEIERLKYEMRKQTLFSDINSRSKQREYDDKKQEYERKIEELGKKIEELEKVTGESYDLSDFGIDTSMLEQDEWDF